MEVSGKTFWAAITVFLAQACLAQATKPPGTVHVMNSSAVLPCNETPRDHKCTLDVTVTPAVSGSPCTVTIDFGVISVGTSTRTVEITWKLKQGALPGKYTFHATQGIAIQDPDNQVIAKGPKNFKKEFFVKERPDRKPKSEVKYLPNVFWDQDNKACNAADPKIVNE